MKKPDKLPGFFILSFAYGSIDHWRIGVVEEERPNIGGLLDDLARGLTCAMSCHRVDADEYRQLAFVGLLQTRNELVAVCRHDTVIVVGSRYHRGGVFGPILQVVQRRVTIEVGEVRRRVTAAIFNRPSMADGEFVVTQHVHDTDAGIGDLEKIRTLTHHGTDEQSAIGAAHDAELLVARVLVGNQVFSCADEVVKHVLLFQQHPALVPRFTILTAPTQVGNGIDSAIFKQDDVGSAEGRQDVDVESAVGIQQGWIVAVHFQAFFVDDEHRHLGAILAVVKYLLGFVRGWVKVDFRLAVLLGFVGFDVVFEDRRRISEGGKGVEGSFVIFLALDIACSADSWQGHLAEGLSIHGIDVDFAACILQIACKNFASDGETPVITSSFSGITTVQFSFPGLLTSIFTKRCLGAPSLVITSSWSPMLSITL